MPLPKAVIDTNTAAPPQMIALAGPGLAREYIEWISSALLTLQHLDTGERQRLEKSLRIQAQSVEHHWHLYPEVIDEQVLR